MSEEKKPHNWSGWPGAYCLNCGIEDPAEQCMATNANGTGCVCSEMDEGEPRPCKLPKIPPCTRG